MWTRLRLAWLAFWGRLANLAGLPGLISECDYSSRFGVDVSIRTRLFYTVISVNGIDVYFWRLSGKIDGVGFSPGRRDKSDATEGVKYFDLPPLPGIHKPLSVS